MKSIKQVSKLTIVLLLALTSVSIVLAQVLFSRTYTTSVQIKISPGLELRDANGTLVTTLAFGTIDPLATKSKVWTIKNSGDTSGTLNIVCVRTWYFTLGTLTFTNGTALAAGDSLAVTWTLVDMGAPKTGLPASPTPTTIITLNG